MTVLVLDDDPTGTQCAAGVDVLLRPTGAAVRRFLQGGRPSGYVLTNTRALDAPAAQARIAEIRDAAGHDACLVLRGDSTLRGHVMTELRCLGIDESVGLVVPAFPAAGRITVDGAHYLLTGGARVNVADTEFARDPVFGYRARTLVDWIHELDPRRSVVSVAPGEVGTALAGMSTGGIVIPDASTDGDLEVIAEGYRSARRAGRPVVVRCAPPLAALLAGARGRPVAAPGPDAARVLVVCGSHTDASSRQLAVLERVCGPAHVLPTVDLLGPGRDAALERAAGHVRSAMRSRGVAVLATERVRLPEHATLAHGARVMSGLMAVVRDTADDVDAIVAKGGITSAEVAVTALGAETAHVPGQLTAGVALWLVEGPAGRRLPVAVVPGNVGDDETLTRTVRYFRHESMGN